MIARIVFPLAAAACFTAMAAAALAQEAPKPQAPVSSSLDAAPAAAPDPLAPPETPGPAPTAPGAPSKKATELSPAPLPEPDPVSAQILVRLGAAASKADNRDDVAGMTAFYTENKGQAVWTGKDGYNPQALKAIREIRNADDWGLDASAFQIPANPGTKATPEALADADIKLSLTILKYARHARGGRLDPPSISEIIDRRPRIYDPKTTLEAISAAESADAYLRGLHPKHEQFKRLRQALLATNKAGSGGSSARFPIPAGPELRPGDDHPQIALLRRRLSVGPGDAGETYYDETLLAAVNRYQRARRLEITGIIDRRLRSALNEGTAGGNPDEKRLRILVNMERWRWMPESLGEFYVWDSVPEQLTRVFDHGKMVLMEKIVVGKPSTPTPTFTANMQFIVFHPEWGVPDGIKVNEIAPKLRRAGGGGDGFFFFDGGGGGGSSEVLRRLGGLRVSINGHDVDPNSVDWSSVDIRRYQFIQGAGERNVLGIVKFRFPNKHDVYMHDTPDRHLFGSAPRAFSHGCMRTQNPIHLAEVLLAHDKGYTVAQVHDLVESGATTEIKLTSQIPVHVAYFTADVDDQGQVRYYPDVYGLDSRIASALKGKPIRFVSDPPVTLSETDDLPRGGDRSSRAQDRPRARPYSGRPWNPFEDWN